MDLPLEFVPARTAGPHHHIRRVFHRAPRVREPNHCSISPAFQRCRPSTMIGRGKSMWRRRSRHNVVLEMAAAIQTSESRSSLTCASSIKLGPHVAPAEDTRK